jgi:hypothetical protein
MTIPYYHYLTEAGSLLLLEDGSSIELEDGSGFLLLDAASYGVDFMTATLFDLTYRVARELGYLEEGIVTSGSVSSLSDTHDRTEDADYWNGGTAWILYDQAGAGAAPEGEYAIINDFATPTISFRNNMSAAPAYGDRYAVATNHVPLHTIISKINQALMDMGVVPYVDHTTITTENNKTEYTLPIAAGLDLREVWLQTYNSDTDDNDWMLLSGWIVSINATGTGPTLILPTQYDAGYKLKLVYMVEHPSLWNATDMLSDAIPLERVVYPAVRDCFTWLLQRTRRDEFNRDIEIWTNKATEAKNTRPIFSPKRGAKQSVLWSQDSKSYPGDRANLP